MMDLSTTEKESFSDRRRDSDRPRRTGVLLAIGSAHLDILSRATGAEGTVDRLGETTIEVGGTACNIAINWAKQGYDARLLTSMPSAPLSLVIATHVREAGVELVNDVNPQLPPAAFSAHISANGELMSAISSMPIERHHFGAEALTRACEGVTAAVLDCNLGPEELARLCRLLHEQGVPIFVAGVSEEKSLRLPGIAEMAVAVFVNRREAAYLLKHHYAMSDADTWHLGKLLGCTAVITAGEDGVSICRPEGAPGHVPALPLLNGTGHTLGAGDAFMATVVAVMTQDGEDISPACVSATHTAQLAASMSLCNLGGAAPLENTLDQLHQAAYTDLLTGLPNRAATKQRLIEERRYPSARHVALFMVDIDHFKSVNDTMGHAVGDKVIHAVAQSIRNSLRPQDCVGRWGGEEFVCVVPVDTSSSAATIAERVRLGVENAVVEPWRITVSVGCILWDCRKGDEALHAALARADDALYRAKERGRNQVCCLDSKGRQ